jgi:hypothetical protein
MSNGSTEQMKMTAGMDLGDNYSHLCLIDTKRPTHRREPAAHHPRGDAAPVRFRTAAACRNRSRHPLALGKPSAY